MILGLTDCGGILGAYGVFKYGTLQEYMNMFEEMNRRFEGELGALRDTKQALRRDVHGISQSVDALKESSDELKVMCDKGSW